MNTKTLLSNLSLGILATTAILLTSNLKPQQAHAQQVINVAPAGQEVPNNSSIAWQFDQVSLVDGRSIKVFLNNQDITGQSILDTQRNYFGYRPSALLEPGNYEVRVEFKNTQGTGFIAKWPFTVASAKIEISSVTHNAADKPLGKGASFLATINGTPGANATVILIQNGKTVRTLQATQVSSGVYVANLTVGDQDAVTEGILVGCLERGGRVVYSVASQAFAFQPSTTATQVTQTQTAVTQAPQNTAAKPTQAAPAPLNVEVTSHGNNASITSGTGFNLAGKATPGATVIVRVSASAPQVGFISIGRDEVLVDNRVVAVDSTGNFSILVPRPTIVQTGTVYTVKVTATRGTEQKTVDLRLVHQ